METCFEFDTSKSEPVSYDMEVSTDDTERKEQIVYLKKKKNNEFPVLDIPPGTCLLTHSLARSYLFTYSCIIMYQIRLSCIFLKILILSSIY